MTQRLAGIALGICLLLSVGPVLAEQTLAEQKSSGAGLHGLLLQVTYDGAFMYYSERSSPNNKELDRDSGWLHGGAVEARYDFESFFARLRLDAMGSNSAHYDGALLSGAAWSQKTSEFLYKAEGNLGWKLFDQNQATFSPYVGLGYRAWRRGVNTLPDYVEDYTWWYGAIGVNHLYRTGKWLLGIDAAVLLPFAMKMQTDVAGLYDKTTFHIKRLPGLRVELPIAYELYVSQGMKLSLVATPYYELWQIGRSPTESMTSGGVPTGQSFYEPKSSTDITGIKVGLGLNF